MAKILIVAQVLFLFSFNSNATTVIDDEAVLRKLNIDIGLAEDKGDRKGLENLLAQELAFRRANGKVVNRNEFLKDVKSRAATKVNIESIKLYGDRAIVTCIVTLKVDGQDVEFHNIRLFIREGSTWKLLGWANERVSKK